MIKEVQMTIRIEPGLRADFMEASAKEHRPAAQVLRELMRAYVNGSTGSALPAPSGISASERRRREDAVAFARASVRLEGFTPSDEAEASARRFVDGDSQLAEFVQIKSGSGSARKR